MHRWATLIVLGSSCIWRLLPRRTNRREFNWVIGIILLTLTLLLSFTGYLLPWDQLSLWAVTSVPT
jgi:hypothetical protein